MSYNYDIKPNLPFEDNKHYVLMNPNFSFQMSLKAQSQVLE